MYKNPAVKFPKGKQKEFLVKIERKSGLTSFQLGPQVGISDRSYREWRVEKSCMSLKAARWYSSNYKINPSVPLDIATDEWKKWKTSVAKKGGYIRLLKYGPPGTIEGRKKGGTMALENMRRLGIIPPPKEFVYPKKSKELAEFVGAMLGDGSISHGQIQIILNKIADKDYVFYVKNLLKTLFGEIPKSYDRGPITKIYLNGVQLTRYLQSIGLYHGDKVKMQVDVPSWIKENQEFKQRCVRGLMDTDGCTFLHKYKVKGKFYQYRKANFANRSVPLIQFVFNVFNELNLHPKITKYGTSHVWLYNTKEVEKYLTVIGTSNPRLLKYQNYKEGIPNGSGNGLLNRNA